MLEIGPGIGVLTEQLAMRAARVVSVEIDRRLFPLLDETLAGYNNIRIVEGDVLKVDLKSLIREEFGDRPVAVCANLPYYITSPILMRLLEERLPVENITVMVQREAAQRLCASPGTREAGAISYAVDYYAQAHQLFTVQPGSFYPAPKVTSAVIRLDVRKTPKGDLTPEAEKGLFRLVRAAFSQRRKTAANAISSGLKADKGSCAARHGGDGAGCPPAPRTDDAAGFPRSAHSAGTRRRTACRRRGGSRLKRGRAGPMSRHPACLCGLDVLHYIRYNGFPACGGERKQNSLRRVDQ